MVGADGTVNGVDSAGNPTDTVIGKVDDTGTVTPVEPTPDPTPPSDTTPPSVPIFAGKIAGDNVIDRHELLSGVALTGKAEAGSTVKIVISDGDNGTADVTLTGKANDHGEFSLTLTPEKATSLKDGTLTLKATATDAAGNTSATATNTEIKLDAALDATYAAAQGLGETQLGLKAPDGFVGTKPTLNQLMEELQTVYDKVTKGPDGDYASVGDLEKDAPNFAKLVHFYSNHTVNQTVIAPSSDPTGVLNLSVHDVYGGGLSLSLAALNAATATGGRIAALVDILGKAQFDLPVIKATATDVVNLEVNKVGSTITEAIDSSLWHNDITFAKLVGLIPEVKPIAVDANTQNLDLRLAADGDTSTVNLMEVRGTVEDITFSGTKGRFGINVDTASVKNIDASNLTDDHSGVYVNTAQIGVTIPLSDKKTVSIGFHADVADDLAFTGSAGNDLLVMTQEKYTSATTLNGGKGTDTLALLGTSEDPFVPIAVTASEKLSGFEKLALVDISDSSVEGLFKIENASNFTGITEFITTNSLTIGGLENNTEISVVNFMAYDVNLDLTAKNANSAVTLNVAMTDHFLMHPESLTGGTVTEHSRAVLTNADNITQLTLTGKDVNATILLTTAALEDLNGQRIDVRGYVGDIQYESGWTYNNIDQTLTDSNGATVKLSGVQNDTTVSEDQTI